MVTNYCNHSIEKLIRASSDHDYGCDNADKTYPHRIESAEAFVDFIGEPNHSVMTMRASAGHGVYGVKVFDFDRPKGQQALSDWEASVDPDAVPYPVGSPTYFNKTVAVFVLDIRSNKSPWKKGLDAFRPDLEGDFLGDTQWEWFEAAIARSQAAVNIVVNGLQIHANMFPDGNMAESWGKYPTAQQRLFDALLQDSVSAPILISGDVHMAQFKRKDCKRDIGGSHFRPVVEMTTSGMTHSCGTIPSGPIDNQDWKSTLYERFESFVAGSMMTLLNIICPWTDVMLSNRPETSRKPFEHSKLAKSKTGKQFSLQEKYGELEFDWDMRTVAMRALGEGGAPLLSAKWTMDQLSGRAVMPGSIVTSEDQSKAHAHTLVDGNWTCVNHRGRVNEIDYMLGHVATGAALILLVPFPLILPAYVMLVMTRKYLKTRAPQIEKLQSHH